MRVRPSLPGLLYLLALTCLVPARGAAAVNVTTKSSAPAAPTSWPPGTEFVPFESRHGLIMVRSTLRSPSGAVASGLLVFDTGAPDLTVVASVWNALRLDTLDLGRRMAQLRRPLESLELSGAKLRDISITGVIPDGVLDESIMGLLGPNSFGDRAILIDYDARRLAIVNRSLTVLHTGAAADPTEPEAVRRSRARFGEILTSDAISAPFRLFRGGRMLVDVCIEDPLSDWRSLPFTLLLDTGASACALFDDAVRERAPRLAQLPRTSDQPFSTVLGKSTMDLLTLPRVRLLGASREVAPLDIEAGQTARASLPDLQGELPGPLHGLLGYTFLRRYRVVIDYADQVLWLLPRSVRGSGLVHSGAGTQRAGVGMVLRRASGSWRVVGLETKSSAETAGLLEDDQVVSIDGRRIEAIEDHARVQSLLEGAPGSQVMIVVGRAGMQRVFTVRRGR